MRSSSLQLLLAALLAGAPCALAAGAAGQAELGGRRGQAGTPGNVLLILADDIGVDKLGTYGEHPDAPSTPTLDGLAAGGVLFRNAYAYPVCSPTRAALMTGRHAFRTKIGNNVNYKQPVYALQLDEVTLPELIEAGSGGLYGNALIGKWHLGSASSGSEQHPFLQGWQRHLGLQTNLTKTETYTSWTKWVGGATVPVQNYVTTEQVDDTLAQIADLGEPWLVMLSLTAAHTPYHAPPQQLHSYALAGPPLQTPVAHFDAAVQATDTELGRLLTGIDPAVLSRTTVLFWGDNGSPGLALTPPSVVGSGKGYLAEGGVNVPFIAWGNGVTSAGVECPSLVSVVDVFDTVAELCGVDPSTVLPRTRRTDSISLVPYFSDPLRPPDRTYVYAEKTTPNGYTFQELPFGVSSGLARGRMIRDARWKLIERLGAQDEFYDLAGLDFEGPDLLDGPLDPEQAQAYLRLKLALLDLVTS